MSSPPDMQAVRTFVAERANGRRYGEFLAELTCALIDINTTPDQSLGDIVSHEREALARIESEITTFAGADVLMERQPINPAIAHHPYYTRPYYTADEQHPQALDAGAAYRDRFNLLVHVGRDRRGSAGRPVILNAHIDTVAPFFPSRFDGQTIAGRGAVDDKGSVAVLVASLQLLQELAGEFGPLTAQPRVYQFVIDEETGGNGSLSASLDKRFRGHEAIVFEATENRPYPANRGAMWFRLVLDTAGAGCDVTAVLPFVLVALADEGRRLRTESDHPLFPRDYVQVNFGTLDGFGKHPAAINDSVAFELIVKGKGGEGEEAFSRVPGIIDGAVKHYGSAYPDRTAEIDDATGRPKLARNYQLTEIDRDADGRRYKLEVFGLGGHMSAMALRDNALIKAGYILKALVCAGRDPPGLDVRIRTQEKPFDPHRAVVTGGVGFTPVHPMVGLRDRLRGAVRGGLAAYGRCVNAQVPESTFEMSFDMVHNEAYASPANCPAMQAFRSAYSLLKMAWPVPLAFRSSCDARIFGNSGYNTVTFGPGDLAEAHSDHERVPLRQLQKGLELITLATLMLTTGGEALE